MRTVFFQNPNGQDAGALGEIDGMEKIVGGEFFPMSRKLLLSAEASSRGDKDEKKEKNAAHRCSFAKKSPSADCTAKRRETAGLNRFYEAREIGKSVRYFLERDAAMATTVKKIRMGSTG